jgi:predicted GIY-YIG superfamily endonuclease
MGTFYFVYILESESLPGKHYTGFTEDLDGRLDDHNTGKNAHTRKFRPWRIDAYFAFSDKGKALAFESYLKSHSGRAFAKKHF